MRRLPGYEGFPCGSGLSSLDGPVDDVHGFVGKGRLAGFGAAANRPMAECYLLSFLFRRTNFIAAIVANDAATAMSIVFIVFLLSYNRRGSLSAPFA